MVSLSLSALLATLRFIHRGKLLPVALLKGEKAEVIEAEALETSAIVSQPIAEVKLPKGVIVAAVARGEETIIA